ncbi:flagellar protein FlaG [Alteribacillus iranensis]|uniref:Flagellar protein FlaG n=1 Tax=Alteribacillus iranensis TaxID=930128 RepID=A0A1I2EJC5_9BACI|nr:flagellar protein FlaG [Alteribacillus iranensis]SFE92859.1 flagellar protein FlaG [Alteribacillus iranensis]
MQTVQNTGALHQREDIMVTTMPLNKIAENKTENNIRINKENLEEQVESMNQMMESIFTQLKFHIHEDLDRIYVQVLERDTEKVIREIPPEKFLDMIASMLEHIGLIIDEKI